MTFRDHVQPILARYGCNSGACHGAAAGKNGFKLSLRGYDDQADYFTLTRHALGRRIIPGDPGRSLLLLKPTGAVPHKGGKKFDTDSLEYRLLSEWVASGAPGPRAEDSLPDRIEITPAHVTLAPGTQQQFQVRIFYRDGRSEDVTRWSKYTSSEAVVTQIEEDGLAKVLGHGESAVTAWYRSKIAIGFVTVPFTNQIPSKTFTQAPRRNFIDNLVLEKLQELNLAPSPRSSDEEFLRRAFLDALGVLPSAAEARTFLTNAAPDKRDALIESLLHREEFVDYWTYKWSDLLLVQSKNLKPAAMWSYYHWIRNHVAANTPWDEVVRQIVTASGSNVENGAANFFLLHDDPRLLAENTSQAFLGMSINCARCHNHPMEKWTNDEYYGFANLFARVRMKSGADEGERIVLVAAKGDYAQPRTGKPQPPKPLDAPALDADDPRDRREVLADWLVAPGNPYFSRAIVNRIWANFFGVGLVEKVDDLRITNPASNQKLLQTAAEFLATNKFDLRAFVRAILQSETYQRASRSLPGNEGESRFYSRYYPKRLKAEVLLDAFSQATGAPTEFKNYPVGWRALQLPDVNVESYFLKSFGRPERERTCDCERTADPSVSQVLHIANGGTLNQKLAAKDNHLSRWLQENWSNERVLDELYLGALSRFPTDPERAALLGDLPAPGDAGRRAALEDLCWAVLSTREFLFNH